MRKNLNLRLFALLLLSMLAVSYFAVDIVQAQVLKWVRTSNPSVYEDHACDVAVDGSGLYIVGFVTGWMDRWIVKWRIEKRSLLTGSLIWTRTSNEGGAAEGVVVDSSGLYVVGVAGIVNNEYKWRIEKRSLTTGALIWQKTNIPWVISGIAVDRTGLYVVGSEMSEPGANYRWVMEKRSLTTGSLIWTRISNPSSDDDLAEGVAVDSTGLYVVGYDSVLGPWRWRIEKRSLTTGSLIWTRIGNSNSWSWAYNVAVDSSGLYIVGTQGGHDPEIRTPVRIQKRSLTTGALIWQKTNIPWEVFDVAVAGSNLYVVGSDRHSDGDQYDSRWRVAKRNAATGALVWEKATDPSEEDDKAVAVAVDRTGWYIVGYDTIPTSHPWPTASDQRWRIEKRGL